MDIYQQFLKRWLDVAFSLTVIVCLSPLLAVICFVTFMQFRNTIFVQRRIGALGVPFHLYKFQTMPDDADEKLAELIANDPALAKEWEQFHKLENDPRVSKISSFLRETKLDELPQFVNVLKGQMSIVGPRPLVSRELEQKMSKAQCEKYLSIKPGITGVWTAKFERPSSISYRQRISDELSYIGNISFTGDVKLIFRTVINVIFKILKRN